MSKELEDAIYLLNLFEASDWKDEERQEKAIEFLKSLKVKVPQYVAEWYRKTANGTCTLKLQYKIEDWLEKQDMTLNQLNKDIKRFGYVVTNDFDEVRIKAPNTWGESVYLYLRLEDSDEDYNYGFTSVSRLADTFERQEAIKLMKDLGVDWELEEV